MFFDCSGHADSQVSFEVRLLKDAINNLFRLCQLSVYFGAVSLCDLEYLVGLVPFDNELAKRIELLDLCLFVGWRTSGLFSDGSFVVWLGFYLLYC